MSKAQCHYKCKPVEVFINEVENIEARKYLTKVFSEFNPSPLGVKVKGRRLNECIRLYIADAPTPEGWEYWYNVTSGHRRDVEWKSIKAYLSDNIHNISIKKKAIAYHKKYARKSNIKFAPDKEIAALHAFNWNETSEGYDFWSNFFESEVYSTPEQYFAIMPSDRRSYTKIEVYVRNNNTSIVINGKHFCRNAKKMMKFRPTPQHKLCNVIYTKSTHHSTKVMY